MFFVRRLRKFPWRQHLYALLPLLVLVTCTLLLAGNEQRVEDFFTALRTPNQGLRMGFEKYSSLGNIMYYIAYFGLLAAGLATKRRNLVDFVVGYLVSLVAVLLLVDLFKFALGRPRPYCDDGFDPFTTDGDNHAFPSGHVSETVATVTPLAGRFGKKALPLILGLSPFCMGFARMFLGEHHPTDLLGAMVAGTFGACLAWSATSLLAYGRRRRRTSQRILPKIIS